MTNIFFTVVEPKEDQLEHEEDQLEHRINFEFDEQEKDRMIVATVGSTTFWPYKFKIGSQQIAELGHLLISMSGGDYDIDSVEELIAGYAEEVA